MFQRDKTADQEEDDEADDDDKNVSLEKEPLVPSDGTIIGKCHVSAAIVVALLVVHFVGRKFKPLHGPHWGPSTAASGLPEAVQ